MSKGSLVGSTAKSYTRRVAIADSIEHVCPVCGHPITRDPVFCGRCETPHHPECWQFFGQCATFACGGTEFTATAPPPTAIIRVTGRETSPVTIDQGGAALADEDTDTQDPAWVRLGVVEGQRELLRLVTAFNAAQIAFRLDPMDSAGLPTVQSILGRRTAILIPYRDVADAHALVVAEDLRVGSPRMPAPGELVNYPRLLALFVILAVVFPQWLPFFGLGAIASVCARDIAQAMGVRRGQ